MTEPTAGLAGMRADRRDHPAAIVFGFGSTLHRDDGVGQWIAEAVQRWSLPNVTAVATIQPLPEHSADLAKCDLAIFVDACDAAPPGRVLVAPIDVGGCAPASGHYETPASVLALSRALYGRCPAALMITVACSDFGIGEGFSAQAQLGAQEALAAIGRIFQDASVSEMRPKFD